MLYFLEHRYLRRKWLLCGLGTIAATRNSQLAATIGLTQGRRYQFLDSVAFCRLFSLNPLTQVKIILLDSDDGLPVGPLTSTGAG
jgi:hypothetical protein